MGELLAVRAAAAFFLALLFAASAPAATYYVAQAYGTDTNTGLSWETAKSNLQSLVRLSGTGNVFNVGAGLYQMTNAALSVTNYTLIVGTNRDEVVLQADAAVSSRVVTVYGPGSELRALTLQGGYAAYDGGGVCGMTSNATLVSDCVVRSNYALGLSAGTGGGGLYNVRADNCDIYANGSGDKGGGMASGSATNCRIFGNTASRGGGAAYSYLTGCSIYGNEASSGGGAYYSDVVGCVVSGNVSTGTSTAGGGGLNNSYALDSLVVSNYAASSGGGMANGGGSNVVVVGNAAASAGGGTWGANLVDSLIANNEAADNGGGSYNGSMVGCRIVSNVAASGTGGGAHFDSGSGASRCYFSKNRCTQTGGGTIYGSLDSCVFEDNWAGGDGKEVYWAYALRNCTVTGNTNKAAPVVGRSGSYTIANLVLWGNVSNTIPIGLVVTNVYTNDPLFIPGTYKIASTSPCVDAGDNTYSASALDFYGRDRVVDGGTGTATVDIGAAEYQSGIDDPASAARKKMLLPLLFE